MIVIDVVDKSLGSRYAVGTRSQGRFGSFANIPCVLLSASDCSPISGSYKLDLGNIRTGSESWGVLRDKEVTHLNYSGHLEVRNTAVQSPIPYRALVDWGQAFEDDSSFVWDNSWYLGDWWSAVVDMHTTYFFYGDLLIIQEDFTWGTVTCDGVPQPPPEASVNSHLEGIRRMPDGRLAGFVSGWTTPGTFQESDRGDFKAWCDTQVLDIRNYASPVDGISALPFAQDIGDILDYIKANIQSIPGLFSLVDSEPVDFGELAEECAAQLDYVDSSVLSLLFDIKDWKSYHSLWKSLSSGSWYKGVLSSLSHVRSADQLRDFLMKFSRSVASLFLTEKYGVETTVSDLSRLRQGLVEFISRHSAKRLHSRRVVPLDPGSALYREYSAVLTVCTWSFPDGPLGEVQKAIQKLKQLGLYPEGSNLYDLIPFSFVVDWFVDFGGFVKQCDTYLDVKNYFPIEYVITSSKWVTGYASTSILPDIPVTGDIRISYYSRSITRELPLPNVRLSWGSGPIGHGTEAGALLLQRVK